MYWSPGNSPMSVERGVKWVFVLYEREESLTEIGGQE
jgi:hypothetical protein